MRRPCLTCGKPTTATRCPDCTSAANIQRGSATQRGYDHAWQRASTAAIAAWVAEHGWICPGWQRAAHAVPAGTLTGDHAVPMAAGGPALPGHIPVLCRSCNSAKRDRIAAR